MVLALASFMALPNLIGLMLLSGLVARLTKEALQSNPLFTQN